MKRFRLLASIPVLGLFFGCTPATPAQEPPAPVQTATEPPSTPPPVGGDSTGAPPSDGAAHEKACGGIAGLQCPAKQYCAFAPEARCGAADMTGTCAPVPDACTLQLDEVCGCDDKTYGNACAAAQAGVSVAMKGACATKQSGPTIPAGKLCGTRGVPGECATGLYCAYKSDCGATDAGGTCTQKPTICTKIYLPVCGCDGKTYGSACTAGAAGVSVASKGACAKQP